ncbi:putative phosphopantothenoylcysteine synthetase [Phycisphaera mikurensis]|uniref:Putative phosphopantothenoylcysteine synthetase n=1 Tax=Phycisphaera mikurensis (strain NBRC 102666 / KCTC 22515 / FYK2301M01) TaxID=1142394 RepID=I0IBL7_PHYMF|nr:putative phosphopantothenoylcysteine synthetase [Phycisphaera mikurensis]MBB6442816.1 phosphopantothenoylcysteine decarboxylase/phosphopantothenate--cysteine ligase [Phycisphaera mikurensis]BAM02655.1 putative phosphopantothenoylcysteine synthetase [Phycisphaera mikurensis NBRC 102666]
MLVTAGPTWEPIDAVRVLSNRSTGGMGTAIAAAAADAGHRVTLLLGPPCPAPAARTGLDVHRFGSSLDLEAALAARFPACELLVMAAAVADHRPAAPAAGKLPRAGRLTLDLEAVPDLVAACAARRGPGQRIVSFSLEEAEQLETRAAAKLAAKGVDAAVANPVATLGSAGVDAVLLHAGGHRERPGPMTKAAFAAWLVGRAEALFDAPAEPDRGS